MALDHAEELEKLEEHIRDVLDLFPWPEDSIMSETGMPKMVASTLRTPQEVNAENRLRDFRAGLSCALSAISRFRGESD